MMDHISSYEPEAIYFGTLSNVEKINMIRLWLRIYALKHDCIDDGTFNCDISKIDTKSYLKMLILEAKN